jgi:hypothetical protein
MPSAKPPEDRPRRGIVVALLDVALLRLRRQLLVIFILFLNLILHERYELNILSAEYRRL